MAALSGHLSENMSSPSLSQHKKSSKENRKQMWLNKDLLVTLRDLKKINKYGQWKQGCMVWEEYRDAVRMCKLDQESQGAFGAELA